MKKAFWNNLRDDLLKNPPNLKQIPSILKDINHAFLSLVPNNKQFRNSINEIIDYEFLGQLIDKNCFSFEQIFKLANFMVQTLKQVGMADKDTEVDELLEWVRNSQIQYKDFKLHLFLPRLFKEVLDRIEDIQLRIVQLQNLQSK